MGELAPALPLVVAVAAGEFEALLPCVGAETVELGVKHAPFVGVAIRKCYLALTAKLEIQNVPLINHPILRFYHPHILADHGCFSPFLVRDDLSLYQLLPHPKHPLSLDIVPFESSFPEGSVVSKISLKALLIIHYKESIPFQLPFQNVTLEVDPRIVVEYTVAFRDVVLPGADVEHLESLQSHRLLYRQIPVLLQIFLLEC